MDPNYIKVIVLLEYQVIFIVGFVCFGLGYLWGLTARSKK